MPLFLSTKGFGWPWCVRGRVRAVIMGLGLVPGNKVILTSGYMAWISVANRVSRLQRRCLRKINLEQRWEAKREGAFWVGLIQDLHSTCHGSSGSRGKRKWSLKRGNNRKGLFLNVLGFTGVSPVMVLSINYHAQDLESLPSLRHTGAWTPVTWTLVQLESSSSLSLQDFFF